MLKRFIKFMESVAADDQKIGVMVLAVASACFAGAYWLEIWRWLWGM